jgi:hypothetical protein
MLHAHGARPSGIISADSFGQLCGRNPLVKQSAQQCGHNTRESCDLDYIACRRFPLN